MDRNDDREEDPLGVHATNARRDGWKYSMNRARLRWLANLPTLADPRQCVEWPWRETRDAVPRFTLLGVQMSAARAALILATNQNPESLHAAHDPVACYSGPGCVNPHHLRWATPQENARDKAIADEHAAVRADAELEARSRPPAPAPPAECWPPPGA